MFVGVKIDVRTGVKVRVLVGVLVVVAVNCAVLVKTEVSRKISTLGTVRDCVDVGDAIKAGKEVAVAIIGAGTMAIPTAPISTNANPLIELIIKSLGYFISIKEPYDYTINQLTIQVKIVIGSLSMLGTDYNFIRLVVKIIDFVKREISAICSSTKTNSLIGYKEKTSVLGVKMVLTLIGSLNSQADRCNIQEHVFFFVKN